MRLIDAEPLIALMELGKASLVGNTEFGKGMIAAMSIDIKVVKDSPTIEQPTWIPVTERLPTKKDSNEFAEVLAVFKNGKRTTCPYDVVANNSKSFICWMPLSALPEPPKGNE